MAKRLSKIVTRTGDDGTTGLGDGSRVPKTAPRIEAIGAVDELNSSIGMLLADVLPREIRGCLFDVQHDLFDLGGELAVPGFSMITEVHIALIEEAVERFNSRLTPLKEFVLPGGSRPASLAHFARTVCRRAERRVITLADHEAVSPLIQRYLNRLSDLLFVLARVINGTHGVPDVLWQKGRLRGDPTA